MSVAEISKIAASLREHTDRYVSARQQETEGELLQRLSYLRAGVARLESEIRVNERILEARRNAR